MVGMSICCIILSGGLSRRFRESMGIEIDKAFYMLEGKPMIYHVYEKMLSLCDTKDIIISLRDYETVKLYREKIPEAQYSVDIIGGSGPLIGLYSSLASCRGEIVISAPNDMPYISSGLLRDLVDIVDRERSDVASPMLSNTVVENLIIASKRDPLKRFLKLLISMKRSKAIDIIRGMPNIYLFNIQEHGYDDKTLANINTIRDLQKPRKPRKLVSSDISIERSFDLYDIENRILEKLKRSIWHTIFKQDPCDEYTYYLEKKSYYIAFQVFLDPTIRGLENIRTMIKTALKELFWEQE